MRKLPIIIAGTNCLSGVTTWADQLRTAFANHPRYEVKLLYIGPERHPTGDYDLIAESVFASHQAVRALAPAVVLPNYMWELFLTAFEPGIHCVGMCHADSDEQYYRPLGWYEPFISKFIAVSRECTDHLAQRVPHRNGEIVTLPYGICIPKNLNRDYQAKPLRLIYAGRVTQLQKRVRDFVPLVESLRAAKVPFVFDILGDGDELVSLQAEMQRRFPDDCVRFHSRVPHREMPAWWLSHDVFLQVSDFEGTSVSMLEAMAHGVVPVVTAASSGIAGVIHDQANGFVVPVGDMAAMARAVGRLAADSTLLPCVGRAAYQSVQVYSMEFYVERFANFLDQMLETASEVNVYERYGMFGAHHPVYKMRERMTIQQMEIANLKRGPLKRFFDGGYQSMLPSKVRRYLLKRSA
jgi:glycosyltransferase involved in cell wall biosynthesis